MSYSMFIDDERFPPDSAIDWVIVRSSVEAINTIINNGFPSFISFDHDLGGDDTAMRVVNFITFLCTEEEFNIPADFEFYVHSQNPIGAKNIQLTMENLIKHFRK